MRSVALGWSTMPEQPRVEAGRRSDEEQLDALLKDPYARAWFSEHLPQLRKSATGNRILYQSLAIAFVLGLAAQIGGYAMKTSASGAAALAGDLLYALGWSLWTGVVVALFVQVVPEVKRRQFKQALAAYENAQRDEREGHSGEDVSGQM
jgi:hypothetical protein